LGIFLHHILYCKHLSATSGIRPPGGPLRKWADYGISRARYSGDLVEQVEVRASPGERMGDQELWTREQVVAALVLGASLVTVREVPAGGYVRGEDVRLVTVGDELYMRTDGSGVVGDHLGDLPR